MPVFKEWSTQSFLSDSKVRYF